MPRLRRLDLIGGAPVRCRELQKVSASILKAALMLAGSGFGEDLFRFPEVGNIRISFAASNRIL